MYTNCMYWLPFSQVMKAQCQQTHQKMQYGSMYLQSNSMSRTQWNLKGHIMFNCCLAPYTIAVAGPQFYWLCWTLLLCWWRCQQVLFAHFCSPHILENSLVLPRPDHWYVLIDRWSSFRSPRFWPPESSDSNLLNHLLMCQNVQMQQCCLNSVQRPVKL